MSWDVPDRDRWDRDPESCKSSRYWWPYSSRPSLEALLEDRKEMRFPVRRSAARMSRSLVVVMLSGNLLGCFGKCSLFCCFAALLQASFNLFIGSVPEGAFGTFFLHSVPRFLHPLVHLRPRLLPPRFSTPLAIISASPADLPRFISLSRTCCH